MSGNERRRGFGRRAVLGGALVAMTGCNGFPLGDQRRDGDAEESGGDGDSGRDGDEGNRSDDGDGGGSDPFSTPVGDEMYEWLFEPGSARDGHYQFLRLRLETVRRNQDDFQDITYSFFERVEDRFADTGIEFDSMDSYLTIGGSLGGQSVVDGSFDGDDVERNLLASDGNYEAREYEDYRVYRSSDARLAYAVGDALLRAPAAGRRDADEVAERLIDTKNGNEDRYRAANDDMKLFLEIAGTPTLVSGGTQEPREETIPENGVFANTVARGSTANVEGETTVEKWIRVFESRDDVDTGEFEDWTNESEQFDGTEDIRITQQGRAVVVKGRTPTDRL